MPHFVPGDLVPAIAGCIPQLSRSRGTWHRPLVIAAVTWAPRADLCMLRLLCEQGRASPRLGQVGARRADARVVDREERDFLVRLFAWAPAGRTDSRRRTRSAQVAVTAAPLPRDVFKLVVSFWRPNREWWWSDYRYSRVNRYDAPWMG